MATVTATIDATAAIIEVSGDVSLAQPGREYRIDDEIVSLSGFDYHVLRAGRRARGLDRSRWTVNRGAAGTTPASHAAGAAIVTVKSAVVTGETLAPVDPFAGGGGGGSSPVLVATTLLTSAQILAMHDTPVELVPAPGAGKAIAVINIAAALDFATTPYETGEDLDVTYDGDTNTLAPTAFTGFLTADAAGGGEFATGPQRSQSFVGLLTAAENKAIVATCFTANPENGDSDVFVTILYAVVDLA